MAHLLTIASSRCTKSLISMCPEPVPLTARFVVVCIAASLVADCAMLCRVRGFSLCLLSFQFFVITVVVVGSSKLGLFLVTTIDFFLSVPVSFLSFICIISIISLVG